MRGFKANERVSNKNSLAPKTMASARQHYREPRRRVVRSTPPGARASVISFAVTLFRVGSALDKRNRGFLPPTRSQPRLGLVAGSRGPTQIHIRGFRRMRASRKVAADESYHADRVSTKRRQAYAHKNHSMEKSLRALRKVAAD